MNRREIIKAFLEEAFSVNRTFPSGVACTYVQLDDEIGVKCYPDEPVNRNLAFKRQRFLNRFRIAPRAYFKFEIFDPFEKGRKIACYVTAHAQKCSYKEFAKLRHGHELKKKLLRLGFKWLNDVKSRNCGFINNQLVLIDCDYNSL